MEHVDVDGVSPVAARDFTLSVSPLDGPGRIVYCDVVPSVEATRLNTLTCQDSDLVLLF